MGSRGQLWGIPAGKRECFSPLIFSGLAWASQGEPHHLTRKKMPLSEAHQPNAHHQHCWGVIRCASLRFYCTFWTAPPFFTMNVTLLCFGISGQESARIDIKRICNYFQSCQGSCKLPSRSSAWEHLVCQLLTPQQSPPGSVLNASALRYKCFSPLQAPAEGAWYFSGLTVGKGTNIRDDPEGRAGQTQPQQEPAAFLPVGAIVWA